MRPLSHPLLILSYDDGPEADYHRVLPVHLRYRVPGEISIVAGLIGTRGFLSLSQIHAMQQAGFEVVSHTMTHNILTPLRLTRPARAGESRLYLHRVRLRHATCILSDPDHAETVQIDTKSVDAKGRFAVLSQPLQADYGRNAEIRLARSEMQREIFCSKVALLNMGCHVASFTYPYSHWDASSRAMVAPYYDSARTSGGTGINLPESLDPFSLTARNFMMLSKADILGLLDRIVQHHALGILYTHSWQKSFATEQLEFIIVQAQQRGISLVTRREALQAL